MINGRLSIWAMALLLLAEFSDAQTVRELAGHAQPVAGVSYSPDGTKLATASFDKSLKLWDVAAAKEIKSLVGHQDMVLTVAFSPDGKRIASGGRDRIAKIWNLAVGEPSLTVPALPATISSLITSPDGAVLVAARVDGMITVLDAAKGTPLREWKAHEGAVLAASFSADGATLTTTGADRTLRSWNFADGQPRGALMMGAEPATHLATSLDGARVITGDAAGSVRAWKLPLESRRDLPGHAANVVEVIRTQDTLISRGSDNTIHIHELASGKELRAFPLGAAARDMTLSPADANLLAVALEGRTLHVRSLADGSLLASRDELPEDPTSAAFLPDGKGIVFGTSTGAVRILAYPFVREFDDAILAAHDGPLTALSRSADRKLLLSASQDKTVRLWNADGSPVRAFALFAPIRYAALAPAADKLAAVGTDNVARVWAINGAELKVIPNVTGPLAFSPDGKWLTIAGPDNKVALYPADFSADPKPIAAHGAAIRALAFTPTSQFLISGGADNIVKVSDVATLAEIRSLPGHGAPITSLAISADGKTLVTGSEDKTTRTWNVEAGNPLATFSESATPIVSVSMSPDAQSIVAASADNIVRFYRGGVFKGHAPCPAPAALLISDDGRSALAAAVDNKIHAFAERLPKLVGQHDGPVRAIAVSSDGAITISAGDDNLVRTWETATGKPLRGLAHGGPVTHLALSADGKLLSAEMTGKARLWNAATGDSLATIDGSVPMASLAFAADGSSLFLALNDGSVRIYHPDGTLMEGFQQAGVTAIESGSDPSSLVVSGASGLLTVRGRAGLWSVKRGGPITALAAASGRVFASSADHQVIAHADNDGAAGLALAVQNPTAIALSPDQNRIAVTSSDQKIRLFDLSNGSLVQEYPPAGAALTGISYRRDGKQLATSATDGQLALWSIPENAPGALIVSYATPAPASALTVLGDNVHTAIASADNAIRVFAPPPPESVDLAGHDGPIFGVAWSADGSRLVSAGADRLAILWDAASLQHMKRLSGHSAQVYGVAFHQDGKILASASGDHSVVLWDVEQASEVRRLTGAEGALYQLAYLPDGKRLIAAGADHKARLWDADAGTLVKTFEGHPDEIYGLSIRADGKRFVTAGTQGTVIVWDTESAQSLFTHKLPAAAYGVAYRADGQQIAVAGADNKVYLIDLPDAAK